MLSLWLIICVFLLGVGDGVEESTVGRSRRSLFPKGSVLQITLGLSTALNMEDQQFGGITYGFQQNAQLPSELHPPLRRRRQLLVYDHVRDAIDGSGKNGSECLMKMVCQTAANQLGDGLLEDILRFIFTPSNHVSEKIWSTKEDYYLEAEYRGKRMGECDELYPDCDNSPLDLISLIERVSG